MGASRSVRSTEERVGNVHVSAFYQYGWYAKRSRATWPSSWAPTERHVMATGQYLSATDTRLSVDVQRRGLSFFRRRTARADRLGRSGGVDFIQPERLERGRRSTAMSSAARIGVRSARRLGIS